MPKKREAAEPALGTDSFLDVLCNMVGILVVLIVVAGLRAGQRTADAVEQGAVLSSEPAEQPSPFVVSLGEAAPLPGNTDTPTGIQPPAETTAQVAPPEELVAEAERLRSELEQVRKSQAAAQAAAQKPADLDQPKVALEDIELAIQQDLVALQNETLRRQAAQVDLDQKRKALERIRAELAALGTQKPKPKVLEHRLAPLAKAVSTKEVHFRLSGNRVSVVPVDLLVNDLQQQIQRQKDFIMTRDRYTSSVGPIDGYRMEYAIQRVKAGNIADELKYGQTMVRMTVSGWVIRAESVVPGETAEEALKAGSRFQQAIRNAGALSTMTFWIYSDSFELYRQLQDFAHDHDLNVAARPLPDGVPIAGSPQGSKSMAQ